MIKMLGSRVLIVEVVEDIKSEGGIILGDTKNSAQKSGKVISIGNLVEEIKVNDKVMFDNYKSFSIDLDGKSYLIMEENNIIGVYL